MAGSCLATVQVIKPRYLCTRQPSDSQQAPMYGRSLQDTDIDDKWWRLNIFLFSNTALGSPVLARLVVPMRGF